MTIEEQILAKYPNYYWGEKYKTYAEFQEQVMDPNPQFYVMSEWIEFGVKLIDLCDGNMHGEIVIVEQV